MPSLKPATASVSPALRHVLLADDQPMPTTAPRLPGWLAALTLSESGLRAAWRAHRDQLLAEAARAGFTPYAALQFDHATESAASRTARRQWSRQWFLDHGY